ncbi:S-adenosyl-L-methionine-dependent methyltransferase [Myriangium duriaei CBS 260.36]|uniref:S-adenosyl-L-methionine-dependent methyltransferase n=1 Tax=Myriangium duriaei CBS 260.36 TaxID=1168546 RepID=A0A9P4MR01_9PEZI|nr:S-adenosyl-L-methionine-dependent methyltransferase [Myriangium duriaei CBS 260.36]
MAYNNVSSSAYEEEHVHTVYEQIASHFSSTRYKPWPIIERFLKSQPPGAVGVDIGCGNGKYLAVNPDIFIVGSDRSHNLTAIARAHKQHDALVADALDHPHRGGKADFAISIAVVHHLSTPERRIEAVRQILAAVKPGSGKVLIYVWALEQKASRRGWDEGDDQDVMVPWVMKAGQSQGQKQPQQDEQQQSALDETPSADRTFYRYYHLYRKGELEADIQAAGGLLLEAGYEKDNWWAIASRNNDKIDAPNELKS